MTIRKRTQARAQARDAQKLLVAKRKLAALSPAGSAERAEIVSSASVVEPHAEASACFACGGAVRVVNHRAEAGLRVVLVQCKVCGQSRDLFYRLASRTLN